MTLEIRGIPGFPGYAAREDGAVLSCRPLNGHGELCSEWRTLRGRIGPSGYPYYVLMVDGSRHTIKAHQAVMWAFVGERPPGMQCCHNDGNPANNHVNNLRWDTAKNNHADKNAHGTKLRGERNPASKLTAVQVAEIRRRQGNGESAYRIAKEFGVSGQSVGAIFKRETWKHVA